MLGTLATYVGELEMTVGLEISYQFKKAIFVDDTIEMRWQITKIEHSEKMRGDILHLEGEIHNAQGQLCTVAHAKALHLHH